VQGSNLNEERRRTPRRPFVAAAEVVEAESQSRLPTRVSELSLNGCYLDTMNPFPTGTSILVKIVRGLVFFQARGKVVYSQANLGMGVAFQKVHPEFRQVLEGWLQEDQIKVLVADDSAVFRKLVEQTLFRKSNSLIFAKTGHEAITLFTEHNPALVIVDWIMPDLSGIEICQHIRANLQASYTYIIILTAKSETESVVAGLAAGADDYLTKPFKDEELVARVGVGFRIVELHQQIQAKNRLLEELALTDSLTGLPNRRAIEEWATRQLSGAARHGFSFWVAVADVDHFKTVNDRYGHEAGDTVLKKFSEILKANSRRSDICGRIGGEEFLMILTHASSEGAQALFERVRGQFEATKFNFRGATISVTASFGAAAFEGTQGPDFAKLVARADAALYSAKRLGRNRVEMATT
jgi:two-component system cell cycle response regulator